MTQAVPTHGFIAPPTNPAPQVQPADAVPGFAVPKPTQQEPAAPAPNQPEPQATPDLAAALAALTAAMQAQAPTPAAAPAPADQVPEEVGGLPESLNDFDVSSIDDPIIRSMATVMQTVGKGLDFDRVLGRALEEGRVDLIDTAYLTEKGGANAKELLTIATGIVQAVAAKGEALAQSVHKLAGGAEQWSAGVAVFNQKAPQELRLVVAQMLDSGKDNLINAGAKLVVEFSKNSGALPQSNPLISQGAAASNAAQALSREEFMREHAKLDKSSRDYAAQRNELFARRALGKQLGK